MPWTCAFTILPKDLRQRDEFCESRFYPHSLETLKDYVRSKLSDKGTAFFAIHCFADIGILIW